MEKHKTEKCPICKKDVEVDGNLASLICQRGGFLAACTACAPAFEAWMDEVQKRGIWYFDCNADHIVGAKPGVLQ